MGEEIRKRRHPFGWVPPFEPTSAYDYTNFLAKVGVGNSQDCSVKILLEESFHFYSLFTILCYPLSIIKEPIP